MTIHVAYPELLCQNRSLFDLFKSLECCDSRVLRAINASWGMPVACSRLLTKIPVETVPGRPRGSCCLTAPVLVIRWRSCLVRCQPKPWWIIQWRTSVIWSRVLVVHLGCSVLDCGWIYLMRHLEAGAVDAPIGQICSWFHTVKLAGFRVFCACFLVVETKFNGVEFTWTECAAVWTWLWVHGVSMHLYLSLKLIMILKNPIN